jgi:hypothetical protein
MQCLQNIVRGMGIVSRSALSSLKTCLLRMCPLLLATNLRLSLMDQRD